MKNRLDAKILRGIFNYGKIDFCSSLRANVKQSSETVATHVATFDNVGEKEPSPAFVTFAHAHEQLLPLTKREGNSFTDTVFIRMDMPAQHG